MHPLFPRASALTHDVIGAAIEVHKDKGPGLLESIDEWCLTMELELRGHRVQNQDEVVVRYKHFQRRYAAGYPAGSRHQFQGIETDRRRIKAKPSGR
jgi:hypothetical protein